MALSIDIVGEHLAPVLSPLHIRGLSCTYGYIPAHLSPRTAAEIPRPVLHGSIGRRVSRYLNPQRRYAVPQRPGLIYLEAALRGALVPHLTTQSE
jgi:hypothetical protein